MTDNVVPGTFTPNYTSRNRVTRPPMYTHGGSSFPRVVTPFGQGRRVSRASYQSLVPRSGSSFLIPVPRSSFRFLVPHYGSNLQIYHISMPRVWFQVPSFIPQEKKSARCCRFESLSDSGFIAPNMAFYRPYKARTDISLAKKSVT